MTDDMGSGQRVGTAPAKARAAPPPQPPLVLEDRGGMQASIPTPGGELRLRTEGTTCELQSWSTYPDGHAMMAGGLRLDAQTLRLAIHALRCALHSVERAECLQQRGEAA
jgi:hypothetical protein